MPSEWRGKLYFYSNDDVPPGHRVTGIISHDGLKDCIPNLIKIEDIELIRVYQSPLNDVMPREGVLAHHKYIVFGTRKWWWSIEKTRMGITLQRSKSIHHVRDKRDGNNRDDDGDICEEIRDKGRYTTRDLIVWLYDNNELKKEFKLATSNCQHFAKKVFDEFAKSKILNINIPEENEENTHVWAQVAQAHATTTATQSSSSRYRNTDTAANAENTDSDNDSFFDSDSESDCSCCNCNPGAQSDSDLDLGERIMRRWNRQNGRYH